MEIPQPGVDSEVIKTPRARLEDEKTALPL